MNWNNLNSLDQIEDIKKESKEQAIAIFKHSTTCSISATALSRFERAWTKKKPDNKLKPYYLDLLKNREISNKVSSTFGIGHQSPQIIVIKNEESVYNESHFGIDLEEVLEKI